MYADDVIIYTFAMSTHELECKLQSCIDNISNWYGMNKLCIDKKKPSVMVIGSKFQLRSLNLDDFAISINVDELQLVEEAKYLGLWIRNDLSWDDHILELFRKMYYYVHMFRRLEKSSHPNYCLTFTSLMCSLRSIMGYLYGVALQKLTSIVYKEFKIC